MGDYDYIMWDVVQMRILSWNSVVMAQEHLLNRLHRPVPPVPLIMFAYMQRRWWRMRSHY